MHRAGCERHRCPVQSHCWQPIKLYERLTADGAGQCSMYTDFWAFISGHPAVAAIRLFDSLRLLAARLDSTPVPSVCGLIPKPKKELGTHLRGNFAYTCDRVYNPAWKAIHGGSLFRGELASVLRAICHHFIACCNP